MTRPLLTRYTGGGGCNGGGGGRLPMLGALVDKTSVLPFPPKLGQRPRPPALEMPFHETAPKSRAGTQEDRHSDPDRYLNPDVFTPRMSGLAANLSGAIRIFPGPIMFISTNISIRAQRLSASSFREPTHRRRLAGGNNLHRHRMSVFSVIHSNGGLLTKKERALQGAGYR